MRTTVQVAAALAIALLAPAGTAAAQGARATLSMPFKTAATGAQTGLDMDLRYLHPEKDDERPPTISKLVIHLPAGTRIDPTAVPVCDASNDEIQARGRDACPPETHVGTGKLDVYLGGPGDPQKTDVVLFNGPRQIVEVVLFEGTNNTAAIERLRVEGETISGEPVQVPPGAPPERRFSASRIVWDIPANGRYLVTPERCDGTWRTSGEFEFADGSRAAAAFDQPCERSVSEPGAGPPATQPGGSGDATRPRSLRVRVTPTTIRRGRPSRVRVRLVASDPACLRGTVRVGRRAARTDARGRAVLVALVRRLARPTLRVDTPCGTTRLKLRTRRT